MPIIAIGRMPALQNPILFEHPLNERTRTLLRLSHLFEQFEFHLAGSNQWQSRAALQSLLDITSILSRADIKKELIKQLGQQQKSLVSISSNPKVDQIRLQQVLDDIAHMIERLYASSHQLGGTLKKNDFLNSISQRAPIPGGSYEFDLPQYHYWLNLPHTERVMQLDDWRNEISTAQETAELLLGLLRSSSMYQTKTAKNGVYQQNLDTKRQVQLIQVKIPAESLLYAEISGSKHRFCIRFLESTHWDHPQQTEQDVHFELKTCAI
ncbi:MAG TPA: cell division protein ZapD [Thiolapillus brandeum]|uniref:Cell division protein ZapD n=1 Tax=Thiolapillus brandeum TaxID=1076588 RepID=A0A831K4H2_9GAMM|nr:cell division protein ZapD [Thiolapillus brandeum]